MRLAPSRQRGITLFGLLFWGVLLAFVGVVGAKVLPTVLEYRTIFTMVNEIAKSNPSTVGAARSSFETRRSVEYGVEISGNELEITKENDKVKIAFAYERQISLGGPVYLLIKYRGESTAN